MISSAIRTKMIIKNLENLLKKRRQAQKILKELDIPAWIIIAGDNSAEKAHLPLIGAPEGASHTAYILTQTDAFVISHYIETDIQKEYGFKTIEVEDRNVIFPLAKNLSSIIKAGTPIALNYSKRFPNVDTLGFGSYMKLEEELKKNKYFYLKNNDKNFISADELIFTIASSKLPYEIDFLKEAANITDEILNESFKNIKSGMTEKQVASMMHKISDSKIKRDSRLGYSWEKDANPIVLTKEGIAKSPHMAPSDRVIKPGSTVYIDFGISVNGYAGDLQHFGYVLKKDETNAPSNVQGMYNLLIKSINAGMRAAVPGALGWHIDKIVRDVIEQAGYPTYKHSTGHQLGAGETHTPGVVFGPLYNDYTNYSNAKRNDASITVQLPIREDYVMTIEPRIQIENGASIEVDGIVTKEGFELFVPIQKKIHLVR